MIAVVPAATPVTIPVEVPTVATEGFALLHTPPEVPSVKVAVAPTHSLAVPLIADIAGNGLTVSDAVTKAVPHEVASV